MYNVIENRRWYLIASGVLVALGIIALIVSTVISGLPLAMDIDAGNSQTIQAQRRNQFYYGQQSQ